MDESTTYVGLDAHKESIQVAMLSPGAAKAVEQTLMTDARRIQRWAKKICREASGRVVCAYEAGPLGYTLQRQLGKLGIECIVVAPSLIPVKPGERIKTDRRDARKLAELLRAGLLTEVHPPSPEQEAVRDLCRAREDAKQDQTRCRHRLVKFLLRRGQTWTRGRRAWTKPHSLWLRSIQFDHPADQATLDNYLLALDQVEARLQTVENQLETACQEDCYRQPVQWLRCFRGIDTITAITIVAELHDPRRFKAPRDLMAYLGLVPTEHSSGGHRRLGAITKAGNGHIRRILIEAAWHYRHRPVVGVRLRQRRRGQPAGVVAIADRAQHRLCRRYRRLTEKGKPPNKATVAVARELVGFIWAVLTLPQS